MATDAAWVFDLRHSSIHFWVRYLMVAKVHGQFTKWTGDLRFDNTAEAAARVAVQIDAASIDTRDAVRDDHLRSADFLDVEKHPQITFASTHVEAVSQAAYHVVGDLTIHGTTRPVILKVDFSGRIRDPWGREHVGFTARTTLDRKDFALNWNKAIETGGVMVGDKVEVTIEADAVRPGMEPLPFKPGGRQWLRTL